MFAKNELFGGKAMTRKYFSAAALAIAKGWQIHRGEMAVLAYGLGVMALAVGVWHLTRETTTRPRG